MIIVHWTTVTVTQTYTYMSGLSSTLTHKSSMSIGSNEIQNHSQRVEPGNKLCMIALTSTGLDLTLGGCKRRV